ncbi:hypothetical protein DC848_RS22795 [Vibrio parahaemolyticus]|uniref:hypothetical protein n=1 Tax=Vibrio parahaemolyticus TaxID=670 RepID=UPI0006A616E2|nr:hypothetical protein [Vibrio parahaemolyticus]EGQ8947407.1 hypothetical protein [Vibrio parahaemolyticus]EGR1599248.1 hypothetical protein [Vibrio parahaemolyticus]EGR1763058.1 hypothetical protein [Vibrio parahaemolyticus]EGR3289703.1 hypothetical protein [Vibrio parahaemolyticus]EJF9982942.1 hypothetical protein [Vibrio parahaemolyticus]
MPLFVVKPSENEPRKPQFSDIISSGIAEGFFASKNSTSNCTTIVITDGVNSKAATIKNISEYLVPPKSPTAKRWIKRVDVQFEDVRDLTPQELSQVRTIKWSSRNVRFV